MTTIHDNNVAKAAPATSDGQISNIPLVDIARSYQAIQLIFEGHTVSVLGGRAVNMLTYHDKRTTNDMDLLVDAHKGDLMACAKRAEDLGFTVETVYSREKHCNSLRLTDEDGTKFDIYHRDMGTVSGIPVADIVKSTIDVDVYIAELKQGVKFNVVAPGMLIIMKFNTETERGETANHKDAFDIVNLLGDHYDGNKIKSFIEHELGPLTEYIKAGIMEKPPIYRGQEMEYVKTFAEFERELGKMFFKINKQEELKAFSEKAYYNNILHEYERNLKERENPELLLRKQGANNREVPCAPLLRSRK
jgi:hypothetical protein